MARRLAACGAALLLAACGSSTRADGGSDAGQPTIFDAGPTDAGTGPAFDAGNREAECGQYCAKLFDCGYFPRPEHPPGYSLSTCNNQCLTGGFPPQSRRTCVATAACTCDAGTFCTSVASCFPSPDGG